MQMMLIWNLGMLKWWNVQAAWVLEPYIVSESGSQGWESTSLKSQCWGQSKRERRQNTREKRTQVSQSTKTTQHLFLNFLKKFQFFFYWRIVNLQRCVGFRYTAQWFSYTYFFQILFRYRWLQNTEYSSLCYTVGPYYLLYT